MDEGDAIARFGLPPRARDLPEIRSELVNQAQLERSHRGDTLVMKEYAVLLFAAGQVDDSLLIWHAKSSSFDAGSSLDIQLLCGAGLQATLAFLAATDSDDARAALAYIRKCEDDFADFKPSEHLKLYIQYYA